MQKEDIINLAVDFVQNSEDNIISKEIALSENVVGMRMFEEPIFAFGASDDKLFNTFKDPAIIGEQFMTPLEWLPSAKTVIAFFLPYTDAVKEGNLRDMSWPTEEWLHARVEGQAFIFKLCEHLNSALIKSGFNSIIPSLDKRFWSRTDSVVVEKNPTFGSNWSERHAAYVCGLGTFGLSKGLITKKGTAGRFGTILAELNLPADKREYEDIYQYCSMCGACAKHCPAQAISIEKGKDHLLCAEFLYKTRQKHQPRFGCGKCQVGVPCEKGVGKYLRT